MKAVVFDMDGVILDTEKLVLSCWEKVAGVHGIPDIRSMCIQCLGVNAAATKELFKERYGRDFPYDEYKTQCSAIFHETVRTEGLMKKPGVTELLEYLTEKGYRIGLASSTRRAIVEHELQMAGVLPYFHTLVCGDMVQKSKPDPEIFMTACENLGVRPEEAYAIEDSYNGIRSAHAAGMKAIMVPDLIPATEEMEELSEVVLDSLVRVKEYIEQKS